jgi:hypothetical protein
VKACVVALLLFLGVASTAQAGTSSSEFAGHHRQVIPVVVVPNLSLADLSVLSTEGAVGLLVPNAGPRTSQAAAFAGMVRGILYNTRLPWPKDQVLIHVQRSRSIPLRGPVIVVGLPPATSAPNDRRYPIAVLGHGYRGVLTSDLTRVPGLVSMADVARTALRTTHALRWRPGDSTTLERLEGEVGVARSTAMGGSVLVLSLLIAFAVLFPVGAVPAIVGALLGNLALGWLPGGGAATRIVLLGLCTIAGGLLPLRRGRVLVGVLVLYALSMAVHASALSLAPLGPELTSRFFGVSNLLETLLLAPALLAARFAYERRGWAGFAAVAALTLVTVSENRLGADGGGAVVVAAGFALLAVGLSGARLRFAVPALVAAAAAVFAMLQIDALSSTPDHLRGALNGGADGLAAVAANRVPLAYDRMLEQWYLVFPLLAALAIGVAVMRRSRSRGEASVMAALLGALAASLLVNDSPGPVTLAGLAAVLALEGGLVHDALVRPVLRRIGPPVAAQPQEP